MKIAVIFSVTAPSAVGYAWKWRSQDSKEESAKEFGFYADCAADAQRCGYAIQEVHPRGANAPHRGFGGGLS